MLVFECLNVDLNLNVSLSVSSLNFAAMSISTSLYVFLPFRKSDHMYLHSTVTSLYKGIKTSSSRKHSQ